MKDESPGPEILLESVDASFDCIEPAYVVTYRTCLDASGMPADRVLCCIKAEIQERFTRRIFGAKHGFVKAVTVLVDAQGEEIIKVLDLPACCVFRRIPDAETVKLVVSSNRTLFTHFAPLIATGPEEYMLFEEPLLRIRNSFGQHGQENLRHSDCSHGLQSYGSGIERLASTGSSTLGVPPVDDAASAQAYLENRQRLESKVQAHNDALDQKEGYISSKVAPQNSTRFAQNNETRGLSGASVMMNRFSARYQMPPISTQVHVDYEWDSLAEEVSPFNHRANNMPTEHELQHTPAPPEVLERSVSAPIASTNSTGPGLREEDGYVCLPVETDEGRKFTLEIDPNETIWRLKQRIQKSRGYSPRIQRLVFNDAILEDHMRISDCAINAASTLVLCLVLDNGELMKVPL